MKNKRVASSPSQEPGAVRRLAPAEACAQIDAIEWPSILSSIARTITIYLFDSPLDGSSSLR